MAQGTFYLYFPDKKAAFTELVRQLNHDMRRAIAEAIAPARNRLEAEGIGFRTFFDYVARHGALYRVVRESEFVDVDTYRWHYTTLAEGYIAGLERAQQKGEINRAIPAETIAWVLMGIAEFVGGRWVLWEGRVPPDEVFDGVMAFIGCALAPRPAARTKVTA